MPSPIHDAPGRVAAHRYPSKRASRATAVLLALLVVVGNLVFSPLDAAADLGDIGRVTLDKRVDNVPAITGVSPGDSFTYSFLVGCDDNPCIDATLTDQVPTAFAGFQIDNLTVTPNTTPPTPPIATVGLTGCSVGGPVTASCQLDASFHESLGDLGGVPQYGIEAGVTFRVNMQLSVPTGLSPSWPSNGVAVQNTATADADNSAPMNDTASVTVEIPVEVAVDATKSWATDTALYSPGSQVGFTVGASNDSNVDASQVVLQDPATANDGATALDTTNPFRYVDFVGLCAPSTLPAGADTVRVDLYTDPGTGTWGWVDGTAAATPNLPAVGTAAIGGIRFTYTSSSGATITAGGAASAQCVNTAQRSTDRRTGDPLIGGVSVPNTVDATLSVPGRPDATDSASDTLTITPLSVTVDAGKMITPDEIPAGDTFSVGLSAKNDSSSPLDSLTITEPTAGDFFTTPGLSFGGFTDWTWPAGATAATFTWLLAGGPSVINLTPASPAPGMPGDTVLGFTITYTGSISPGTTAGMTFDVTTDSNMIAPTPGSGTFSNTVGVSGTNAAGTDTDQATADVVIYYPSVEIATDKQINPETVTPGGTALVSLPTETATNRPTVNPDRIEITDAWDGTADSSFWNAFEASEIVFTDVPSGSQLEIQVASGTPPGLTWTTLASGITSMYSNDLSTSPVSRDDIVGFRFIYTNAAGFAQGTIVQPNLLFAASDTLRSGGPTTITEGVPVDYDNEVSAQATAWGGSVTSDVVTDTDDISVVSYGSGGPGTIISNKRWVTSNWSSNLNALRSQSGSTARTLQHWGVTVPGYTSVVLGDPAPNGHTDPANTVFQAFDLTRIDPISFALDPLLRWDTVSKVELYNHVTSTWVTVAPPLGTWMNATGFKGHTLTAAQAASTTGVRVTVVEDTATRTASVDPSRPAPGSGVASSVTPRPLRLTWRLRNVSRVTTTDPWVTADSALNGGTGTPRNTFDVSATDGTDTFSNTSADNISLIDTNPGVQTAKSASKTKVVVPVPGDVPAANYPSVNMTVDAWNTADARASYIRVVDPIPCATASACVTPGADHSADVFTGNTYDAGSNPFERFDITGVNFSVPAAVPIDPTATQVALWHYDELTGTTSVTSTTMAALDAMTSTALADVVGVGIVYQSTDPGTTGGLIPKGSATSNKISMVLQTRLRVTRRSNGDDVTGGITVHNDELAQSFDPVLSPSATPHAEDDASVELSGASLGVTASKSISPATILETDPGVPVTVTLGATDGDATMGAETLTITDTDTDFWDNFELDSLGTVTRPTGADLVQVDVQTNDNPTWIPGTPGPTAELPMVVDPEDVTGIRFVFSNSPTDPFSNTVPSADWSASAVLNVHLRDGVDFPGEVDNTVQAEVTHTGYDPVDAEADATVTLSTGTPALDVAKDPHPPGGGKVVEPGTVIPWTLTFTNSGNALVPIETLTDDLGPNLTWDGTAPTYTSSGALPTAGIGVTSPSAGQILFDFPDGSVMSPGDSFTITLGITLEPGLMTGEWATNSFVVDTGVTLDSCTNTSGNAQGVLSGLADDQCGTSNEVTPAGGPLLLARKGVNGDVDGSLVFGAQNISDPTLPCNPDSEGFYSGKCAARTGIGLTDEWKLSAVNTGTVPYTRATIVDVLPHTGDRLLATGSARGSQWRPVLDVGYGVVEAPSDPLPAGATMTVEATSDVNACVGTSPGSTDWNSDPTCSTHPPAVQWHPLSSFTTNPGDVAAIRVTVDWTGTVAGTLDPGQRLNLRYRTINVPRIGTTPTSDAVEPTLYPGPTPQRAWNQIGVTAQLDGGGQISRAPQRTGVQLEVGALAVAKSASGQSSMAPGSVDFSIACTIPDGTGGQVALDLGVQSTLSVLMGKQRSLEGIPLGATCTVTEDGEIGAWGETSRDPSGPQQVLVTTSNGPNQAPPDPQTVSVTNAYDYGSLQVDKRIAGTLPKDSSGEFTMQVKCSWQPAGTTLDIALPDNGVVTLTPSNDYEATFDDLPAGARCTVTETDKGGANKVEYAPTDAAVNIEAEKTSTLTVTNVFDPPGSDTKPGTTTPDAGNTTGGGGSPSDVEGSERTMGPGNPATANAGTTGAPLAFTGGGMVALLSAVAMLMLLAGFALVGQRRRLRDIH